VVRNSLRMDGVKEEGKRIFAGFTDWMHGFAD
jgi:hypothetical protein